MNKITDIIIIVLNIAGLCLVVAMLISAMVKKVINKHNMNKNYSPANKKIVKSHMTHENINSNEDDDIFDDMDLMDFDDLDLDDFD